MPTPDHAPARTMTERLSASERVCLGLLVLGLAGAYSVYSILRHWHFLSNGFDLGIFDQAVWQYSRFELPRNSFKGHERFLGDHFHPIVALIAPLYWIWPRPETLLVVQAALLAASVVPVYLHARAKLGSALAWPMAIAGGLFWGIQKAVAFDFHEVAFAPSLIAMAILAMEGRRWPLFWSAAFSLVLVKEDLPLVLAAFGVVLALRGEVRRGAVAFGAGVLAFGLVMGWILPSLSGASSPYLASYLGGEGPPWARAAALARALVAPAVKLETFCLWVGPFLFLPLLSPLSILGVPIVLALFLSPSENLWRSHFHYSAPLAPILAMAAVDGLVRVRARLTDRARRRATAAIVTLVTALCAVLPGRLPIWRLFSPAFYRFADWERTGHEALAAVPEGRSVVAQDAAAPHLSQRHRIYSLQPDAPKADYVIASGWLRPWPNASPAEVERLLEERRQSGYEVVFQRDGWTVLRSPAAGFH